VGDERRFVVNASPLIFLARIEQLSLLRQLAEVVVAPVSVLREVLAGSHLHPSVAQIDSSAWLHVEADLPLPLEIAGWDLGAGESQVLAHAALRPGWEAVLDDLQARRCARSLGIPITGTLGVILRARKSGIIPAARPLVEELLRTGLHLSRDLAEDTLAEIGE
jgi:predicted nucleic acid-binding protein